MVSRIYLEKDLKEHPRVQSIVNRFSSAPIIMIDRYTEVFNRRSQNFRLQKNSPALILARKHNNYVLSTPETYGIGGLNNFYFSHMLNCLYDCRYCFLQGLYSSAHYVLFINYEDFWEEVMRKVAESSEPSYFFSGYDGDSLALESLSRFCDYFVPLFVKQKKAYLELRTKSIQIKTLLRYPASEQVVVAWSLTPQKVSGALEHKVPPLKQRLQAMVQLAQKGWPIGLRFDPLIYHQGWQESYQQLIKEVFEALPRETLHSVSLGPLRFPRAVFSKIVKLYPDDRLLSGPLHEREHMISYSSEIESSLQQFCRDEILKYVDGEKLFSCTPEALSL